MLTNVERARAIGRYLPLEIKPMLQYVRKAARHVVETNLRDVEWDNGFISKAAWIAMAKDVLEDLDIAETQTRRNPAGLLEYVMAQRGFMFLIHMMIQYSESEECKSKQMKAAINFFFIA